ncbi:MAG: polyprenyl synthetase family protein [Proteobacteria bacterium]|nr:polyprenyl synthetase family protein [Pseudomonadota bacterium]
MKTLEEVLDITHQDMQQVNATIRESLDSHVALIKQISTYIINSGGKRLRPILVVLMAQALAYKGKQHIHLAAIIEFIHTATLLHDDVVDESDMRRGNKTANEVWGNSASVLVGDFLYSRAFQMMVTIENLPIMDVLANATNTISEGEVLQLLNIGNLDISEEQYYQIIHNKTAQLFEAGCELSALISCDDKQLITKMANYGKYLGMAFQIADDMLDYSLDNTELDKNIGDDLVEGKLTLPLIYLLEHGNESDKKIIAAAIKSQSIKHLKIIQQRINDTSALTYTQEKANGFANLAKQQLTDLPASEAKDALLYLCDFACHRNN